MLIYWWLYDAYFVHKMSPWVSVKHHEFMDSMDSWCFDPSTYRFFLVLYGTDEKNYKAAMKPCPSLNQFESYFNLVRLSFKHDMINGNEIAVAIIKCYISSGWLYIRHHSLSLINVNPGVIITKFLR